MSLLVILLTIAVSSCVNTQTRPLSIVVSDCASYVTWKACIEEICTDEQVIELANDVRDCRMNQETAAAAKSYTVDIEGFKAGFITGAASVGIAIKTFFTGWWGG